MKKPLWTAFEAASATGGMLCARGGDPDRWEAEEWRACGLSIDSRTLNPGEIFIAVKDVRDGHDFIEQAFEAGAAAALVTRAPVRAPDGKPFLVVRDTMEGLRDLARAARLRNFGKRIAVTGSAGKTSTKEMMRAMLAAAGDVHAADRSFNNHLGVPLTLASLPMTSRYAVFEIGMNHAGEITPLVDLVRPHAAIITTVGEAHLEFFDSVEGIAEAKAEILTGIKPGGTAILPIDNAYYPLLRKRAELSAAGRVLTFGESASADLQLLDAAPEEDGESQSVTARYGERTVSFTLGAPGRHQAMNALAAILAVLSIGAPEEVVIPALADFRAADGRGQRSRHRLPGGGVVTLIDESYNANPASMAAALGLLGAARPKPGGRRIAVLGEMLELGPTGPALHAALAAPIEQAGVTQVFASGAGIKPLWDALPEPLRAEFSPDIPALTQKITRSLHDGDIVMVKGSNASGVQAIARAIADWPEAEE